MQKVPGVKKGELHFWVPILWIVVLLSTSLSFYLFFLQTNSTALSEKKLLVSGLVGLFVLLIGVRILYPVFRRGTLFSRKVFVDRFSGAFVACIFLWVLFSVPENFLFAKSIAVDLSIQAKGEVTGPVEIVWMNNGLEDISYTTVTIPPNSTFDDQSIRIPISVEELTKIGWTGRVWKQLVIVVRSPQSIGITVNTGSDQREFEIESGAGDKVMAIPVVNGWRYLISIGSVFVSTYFAIAWLIFIISFFPLSRLLTWIERVIPHRLSEKVVAFLGVTAILFIFIFMVRIGFYNRMYADDYCYTVMYRENGFLGALGYAYQNQNGRLMSHLFNFSALIMGRGSIPFGPVVILVLVGGSLFFLITQLITGNKKSRMITALFSTLVVMAAILLMVPSLYTSVFWTLHALILAGGISFLNIFLGLLARFAKEKISFTQQARTSFLFLILNIAGANFHESISIESISLSGLVIILALLSSKRKEALKSGLIIPMLFAMAGSIIGLALVLLSAGNNKRISALGYEVEFVSVLNRFYTVVQDNLQMILLDQFGTGLAILLSLLVTGYAVGRLMPLRIRYLPDFGRLKFSTVFLLWLPLGLTIVPFVPAAFVNGFYPIRTLFIPIYVLAVFFFFESAVIGFWHRSLEGGKKLLPYSASMALIFMCILSISILGNFSRQMRSFAAEWDTREISIQQAVVDGKTEIRVKPFQTDLGVEFADFSPEQDHWLKACLEDYYSIGFSYDHP